jgi:hypothetical protein
MKSFCLLLLTSFFLFSCEKEEVSETNVPDWFQPTIEELENSGECFGCTITKIPYNGEIYYHLYCGYWSCMYCNLYDSRGNLVDWDQEKFDHFLENKSEGEVIWKCGD